MSLSWKDLFISVLNKNKSIKSKHVDLIKGTSGNINPGEVLAIMGPSGGGKSTLINALAGRIPKGSKTQGSISYNDKPRTKNSWFDEIGFVEQEMLLLDNLSVYETLYYHHKLGAGKFEKQNKRKESMNKNTNQISKLLNSKEIVDKIISDLNLSKVKNNLVNKLSGGERKRTTIGTILVNEPNILFLDEPTSGLDTLTSLKIIKSLKKIAVEQQKIVVLTIHQPSLEVFSMFNDLILLSGGTIMFYGKAKDVHKYFCDLGFQKREFITVPEHIMEICSDEFKFENPNLFHEGNDLFRKHLVVRDQEKMKTTNTTHLGLIPSIHHVFILLMRRFVILKRNKTGFIKTILIRTIILALIISIGKIMSFFFPIAMLVADIMNNSHGFNVSIPDAIRSFFKRVLIVFLGTDILFTIIFTISLFFEEISLIKEEMTYQFYSASSFYIFVAVFQLIQEWFTALILFIIFLLCNHECDVIILTGFFITPIVIIPFGLLLGSIIPTKTLITIFGFFFGILCFFQPGTWYRWCVKIIYECFEKYPNRTGYKMIVKLFSLFLSFLAPFHYFGGICYKIRNNKHYGKMHLDINKDNLRFFMDYIIEFNYLYLIVPVSCLICLFLGILVTGFKTEPSIRLQMEKKKK